MKSSKKAVLLGATGLIGKQLFHMLLDSDMYAGITVLVRKRLPEHPKLQQIVLSDFAEMDKHADAFAGVEDVFCCLGTTIRRAGSQEHFRKVDFEYPVMAANLAKAAGARRYLIVSAMGADASSKIFYSRVKGEMEAAIRALRLPMVSVMRPSLLLGQRDEFRFGERIAVAISRPLLFLLRGALLKYRPIAGKSVAAVMLRVAQMYLPGVNVYENDQLHRLASSGKP